MTQPRSVVPESTYLITRRCTQRLCFLRPDRRTNEEFSYLLAEAAGHCGVKLVTWLAMPNHYRAIVHDTFGRLPEMIERLHRNLAIVGNHRLERSENFWSSTSTSVVLLPTPEAIFDGILYVLSNPVAGFLVDRHADWPGASGLGHLAGKRTTHQRPKFFSPEGKMPESVMLGIDVPPMLEPEWSRWVDRIRDALLAKEDAMRARRERERIKLVGRKRVLATPPTSAPQKTSCGGTVRPEIATRDETLLRIARRLLAAFRAAYHAARSRMVAGELGVRFPAGTWKLRRFYGVLCDDDQLLAAA